MHTSWLPCRGQIFKLLRNRRKKSKKKQQQGRWESDNCLQVGLSTITTKIGITIAQFRRPCLRVEVESWRGLRASSFFSLLHFDFDEEAAILSIMFADMQRNLIAINKH